MLAPAPARAEMPEAGDRERQWELARAYARLVVGEEEHVRHALRGAPHEILRGLADMVMEFELTAKAKP